MGAASPSAAASRMLLRAGFEEERRCEAPADLTRWQQALLVLAGAASSAALLQGGSLAISGLVSLQHSPDPGAAPGTASASTGAFFESDFHDADERESLDRYAFVQVAHDEPGAAPEHVWRAMAMARAVQRLSRYPLVVLTNTTELPGGVDVRRSFAKLGARVLPVYDVPVPLGFEFDNTSWRYGFWKLQIWRLTQFEKLIWLDTDAILTRSVDWLFQRRPIWAQSDDEGCEGRGQRQVGGGLMLVEPNNATFRNLMHYADTLQLDWWKTSRGDVQLISEYFQSVEGTPVGLLHESTAAYTSCLGRLPGNAIDPAAPWDLPAFVHGNGKSEDCFYWDVAEQLAEVQGQMVNICHYHPLGQYWRDLFCDAIDATGVETEAIEAFCDDLRWNRIGRLQVDLGTNTSSDVDLAQDSGLGGVQARAAAAPAAKQVAGPGRKLPRVEEGVGPRPVAERTLGDRPAQVEDKGEEEDEEDEEEAEAPASAHAPSAPAAAPAEHDATAPAPWMPDGPPAARLMLRDSPDALAASAVRAEEEASASAQDSKPSAGVFASEPGASAATPGVESGNAAIDGRTLLEIGKDPASVEGEAPPSQYIPSPLVELPADFPTHDALADPSPDQEFALSTLPDNEAQLYPG